VIEIRISNTQSFLYYPFKDRSIPVQPISVKVVILCAASATTLPRTTILSQVDICAFFCAAWAALNLATFWAGVSVFAGRPPEEPGEVGDASALRGRGCDRGYEDDGENVFEAADWRELGLE